MKLNHRRLSHGPGASSKTIQVCYDTHGQRAIGAIAVQWSQLEGFITAFVHALTDDKAARDVFNFTRAVDQRLDQWQAAVEREILPEHQPRIIALSAR